MQTQSVNCNNCGAPLDVPSTANFVTCTHCGSRLSIQRNNSVAYTEVLDRIDHRTETMSSDLENIRLQNQLEQVDREWQIEREKYRMSGRNGSSLPSRGNAVVIVLGGMFGGAFLIFWLIIATGISAGIGVFPIFPCFPLFGVGMLLALIGLVINSLVKTSQYSEAEQGYQRRRAEILSRMEQPTLRPEQPILQVEQPRYVLRHVRRNE